MSHTRMVPSQLQEANTVSSFAHPCKCIVSTWSDLGVVSIYQFDKHFAAIEASVSGPTVNELNANRFSVSQAISVKVSRWIGREMLQVDY